MLILLNEEKITHGKKNNGYITVFTIFLTNAHSHGKPKRFLPKHLKTTSYRLQPLWTVLNIWNMTPVAFCAYRNYFYEITTAL